MKAQNKAILEYLQSGNRITSLESFKLFNCTRLSARIYDLKRMGHTIIYSWIQSENGKRYKAYYLGGL